MLRRGGRLPPRPPAGAAARPFATTGALLQLQQRERILQATHGAGLVAHGSMATPASPGAFVARGVTTAPPAADLFRTPVHEGLGTSADDPYSRTLPNQESRPPETTVLRAAAASAPTLDEINGLGKRWASMQYWIGDTHARLPIFLRSLVVSDALPVSPRAAQLAADFLEQLPKLMADAPDVNHEKVATMWRTAQDAYGAVGAEHLLDRTRFEEALDSLHTRTTDAVKAVSTAEGVLLAFEVLRRQAVVKRNEFILRGLLPLVEDGAYLGYGDAVWRVFFAAVERQKAALFDKDEQRMLGFAWDAIMTEDAPRTPAVTGVVALYVVLASLAHSHALVDEAHRSGSRTLDEGIRAPGRHTPVAAGAGELTPETLRLVNPMVKRRFAMAKLQELLASAAGSANLSKALRAAGLHELSREAALCEAMNDTTRLLEDEAVTLVTHFDSTQEVKTLLSNIVSGTDEAARQHVLKTFGQPSAARDAGAKVDWDKTFLSVDWENNWRRLALRLLSDTATLEAAGRAVGAAIGAKSTLKRLFSEAYAEAIKDVVAARQQRLVSKAARTQAIVDALSSHAHVDTTVSILQDLGVPLTELAREVAVAQDALRRPRQRPDVAVLEAVLAEVARRHPSWVRAGVLPQSGALRGGGGDHGPRETTSPAAGALDGPALLRSLELLMRMYVRLAYVPNAGAASIAQHTRRRIGAVAVQPHQFNVPAEMGFVEQYDNLQYKRYDWQGWYQRMTDVHNRNVSVRCRLDDLRRLDGRGNPFFDLQTERRLRVIAGDRVGMGVLKLDSDKYEDQSDNVTHGTAKLSELLAESRKAQLGPEYWPTVEVKVRRPSGQSQAYYSIIDDSRIEKRSQELFEKYRDAKKRSLFVTPMDLWLEVKGMQVRKTADTADADGYTVDSLQDSLGDE